MENKLPSWVIASSIYLVPLLLILFVYRFKRRKTHLRSADHLATSISDGLTEASSLHPIIDPVLCIGCGSCVSACPEKNVLGLVHHQAELISPSNCIGHGACKLACPENAITLVFGSAKRGMEIPEVSVNFESNIPGIFIAGELGGMGLIRNAIEQGRQAMDSIAKHLKKNSASDSDDILDCLIVGSGPAGLSATLGATSFNLNSITIDQDSTGGTVSHFPRGKLVMTQAAHLPLVGKVKWGHISKEKLLSIWFDLIEKHQIKVQQNETLLSVACLTEPKSSETRFEITTSVSTYKSRTVLLALGRRGTPRKLDVPGEELTKVVYRLDDPEQYRDQSVLVVGGGDSAIEAACSIAELNGSTEVTLSYRKDSFARVKAKNRQWVDTLSNADKLNVLYSSQVTAITENAVTICQNETSLTIANQAVLICVGGILPTGLLKDIGVKVATKYGEC